jgi:hypothetical protein
MTGLDPAIHALLWMWPRRGYPACAGHDCVWFERARVTLVQIQLSNSRCSSDMRHRPHCLRRGAPSSLAFPPLVRGRAERQVPVAPLGLMRCGLPQLRVHQDFRRRRAIARRSACGVFSVACTSAMANGPITKINVPGRRDRVAAKHLAERVLTWSSVTLSRASFHPKIGRLLASGSAGADPSCPKTDVTPNRVTPHLRRPPHPTPRT